MREVYCFTLHSYNRILHKSQILLVVGHAITLSTTTLNTKLLLGENAYKGKHQPKTMFFLSNKFIEF